MKRIDWREPGGIRKNNYEAIVVIQMMVVIQDGGSVGVQSDPVT